LSGTEVRRRLQTGEAIPEWFSPPKVVEILRRSTLANKLNGFATEHKISHPAEVIKAALELYGEEIAISFSGAEDVLLVEYAS